ncbi:MAG: J domain-containing protein [Oculatellaceae cyanobacterium Prado106]|jgi:curved DNA-binding protein CbpA|nr:J domain-containing protein [Oculatellaceae cyanobacterium Prado106]
MSFKIDQGLFNLDFTDYHAILGVAVDADMKDIRKSYLKVARRLHPDSCASESESVRQQAAEILSKLVNPAYEKLSQERNYAEYCILLKLKGQQALKQQETVLLVSDPARKLAATNDIDNVYRNGLRDLTEKQYEDLSNSLEITGQISELNLVYLMRKEGRGELTLGQPKKATPGGSTAAPASTPTPASTEPIAQSTDSLVEAYLRRAQEFEKKQDYPRVILELRDAIRIDPTNSNCHSRLGEIYLKTNQAKMAKIHFAKALELNPEDKAAQEGNRKLLGEGKPGAANGKVDPKAAKGDPKSGKPAPKSGKVDPKANKPESKGGLFGLFGNKK